MNYLYYKELRRKEMIRNTLFISFILLFAVISTYLIYNNFKEKRDEILKSNSIDVVYHVDNNITITKATPVSDSVGLSSKAYTFTVKNNTDRVVNYAVSIKDDVDKIYEDNCRDIRIPLNFIKVGIHKKGEVSKIYTLDDLDNGILRLDSLRPRSSEDYTLRFWVSKSSIRIGANLHYHGIIEVAEK